MTPLSLPSRTKHSDRTWKLAQRTPRPSRCSAAFLFRSRSRSCCLFFFFQAEDGIRDKLVTGVQTCALPISAAGTSYDQVEVTGAVALGGNVTLQLSLGFNPVDHMDAFTLILNGVGPLNDGRDRKSVV